MIASPSVLSSLRRPLVWLLVLATLAYGPSSVLVGLLGPAHVHRVANSGPGPWDALVDTFAELRAWRAGLHQRWLPRAHGHAHAQGHGHVHADGHGHVHADGHGHVHADGHGHAAWERHHHARQDGSVIALDGAAAQDAANSAAGGSAALPLALAPPPRTLPARVAAVQAWQRRPAARWSDAPPRHEVPPPRG